MIIITDWISMIEFKKNANWYKCIHFFILSCYLGLILYLNTWFFFITIQYTVMPFIHKFTFWCVSVYTLNNFEFEWSISYFVPFFKDIFFSSGTCNILSSLLILIFFISLTSLSSMLTYFLISFLWHCALFFLIRLHSL